MEAIGKKRLRARQVFRWPRVEMLVQWHRDEQRYSLVREGKNGAGMPRKERRCAAGPEACRSLDRCSLQAVV